MAKAQPGLGLINQLTNQELVAKQQKFVWLVISTKLL